MKVAMMGNGDIIVSSAHKKSIGTLITFSKAKRRMPLLKLEEYQENPISRKEVGKGLFQIYFSNKESLKRLIDNFQIIYEEWGE